MPTRSRLKLFIVSVALFAVMGQAKAVPLIDFTSFSDPFVWFGNTSGCTAGCTLGYSFDVSSSVTIDGLGVFDFGSDGLNNDHEIGIWNTTTTALLATAMVGPSGSTSSDVSASGAGNWLYSDIASLTLTAGTRYTVGALFEIGHTDRVIFNAGGIFSNDPGAAYDDLKFINSGVLALPTGSGDTDDRYFGAGMRIEAAAVPEPSTLLLLGAGLMGLGVFRRVTG